MKVYLIASLYNTDSPSGENLFVKNIIETFERRLIEFETYLIHTPNKPQSFSYNIRTAFLQILNFGNSPKKKIKKFNPDVILISNMFPNISSRWMKKNKIPVLYFQHNFRMGCIAGTYSRDGQACFNCSKLNHFEGIKHRCYKNSFLFSSIASFRFLVKRSKNIEIRRTEKFIVLEENAIELLEIAGINQSKMKVLNNFLPDLKKNEYQEPSNSWIYSGRLSLEKGISQLISIWPNSEKLDIYGDGILKDSIELKIKNRPNISYKGFLDNEDLQTILRRYRGAVFPSVWREGFPMVSLEYLRSGIPIIAAEGNAVAKIVKEAKSGVLFKLSDAKSLSEGLIDIANHRNKYAYNARSFYENNYSEEIWFSRLMKIINETVKNMEKAAND